MGIKVVILKGIDNKAEKSLLKRNKSLYKKVTICWMSVRLPYHDWFRSINKEKGVYFNCIIRKYGGKKALCYKKAFP